ncbi:hypothetical protein XENOCAPTIV_009694 [Xenoophorus captivus]|uniref:FHA domain-containing protein n=1 Tax=Xenoophorus captivus TaxID=1517983 RepID=A0ABV0RJN4_9TELE
MYVSSFLVATGVSCIGFRSTPFISEGRTHGDKGMYFRTGTGCTFKGLERLPCVMETEQDHFRGKKSAVEYLMWDLLFTFDADAHVRINALAGVLQPNFLYSYCDHQKQTLPIALFHNTFKTSGSIAEEEAPLRGAISCSDSGVQFGRDYCRPERETHGSGPGDTPTKPFLPASALMSHPQERGSPAWSSGCACFGMRGRPIELSVTVGRGVEVTHQLLSSTCPLMISRLHCSFMQREDGQWTVTDKKVTSCLLS